MITWAKPSGFGNWWIQNTEFLIFAYKQRCQFNGQRYIPNFYEWREEVEPNLDAEPAQLAYKWPRAKIGQHSKKPGRSAAL